MTRPIPHSGEELPIVGLGTAVSFPSADESQRAALKDVIDALVAGGGKLIDTASVYGNAESVIGDIVRASNARNKIFIATKIEVRSAKAGADEFQRSLQRLRAENVDLLQLHNVSRASQSLSQFREWKAAGKSLPDWAKDFDAATWGQFFLKYLLGDERVTAVIPGSSNSVHMADNLGAMRGRLPDSDQRNRMVAFVDSL